VDKSISARKCFPSLAAGIFQQSAVFQRQPKSGRNFVLNLLKKIHNILNQLDFQESKIDVLTKWISVPRLVALKQKNAQDEYTVITIITRFYVHQDK
jgi:hypothetical protein